ncbi:MAG: HlyC/CorC family transporter [Planctomycetaceae bacterium]|nr:HlyC/CorC family transporter [Planctomycetaceae bacterium]
MAGSFLVALGAFSLRDFSRSRLEEACAGRGRPHRFGVIIREYGDALLALEWLLLALVSATAVAMFHWLKSGDVEDLFDAWGGVAVNAVLFMAAGGFLVVVLPWCIARVAGEKILAAAWPAMAVWKGLMRPFLAMANKLDTYAHRLTGLEEPGTSEESEFSEELRTVVDEGQREGIIEHGAGTIIRRVIELQESDVSAIMTQRTDMVTIPATASLDEARLTFLECGHSRIPVIGETADDVVGVLYAKDLLQHLKDDPPPSGLRSLVREPLYVPETSGIDKLLETMKRDRVHFALAIDEYGNVAGLVTMEDILEEIVGEIGDEYDTAEESGIYPVKPGVVELESWVRVDDLNEQFDYELPDDEDFATIGGFVLSRMGRIPKPGDNITWEQLRLTVLSGDKRRIERLRVEADPSLAPKAAEED